MDFYSKESKTAFQAMEYAQFIAFGPIIFQASKCLRDFGILQVIENAKDHGIELPEIVQKVNIPAYGVRVLVEAGLGIGLILFRDNKYTLSKTGYFLLSDTLTKVNMNFTHDICYQGMFELDKSIINEKPEGLKTLGSWKTVYEGLSQLNPQQQKSWFEFDHFYSDKSFPEVLPIVYQYKPKNLLDIGGNTGKWSIASAQFDEDVHLTIFDLPGQGNMAKKNIEALGLSDRISFYLQNILDETLPFPKGFDAIWMSQFLDCFSDDEIFSILSRCYQALNDDGQIYILECFWDQQKFASSALSLQMTSLYFTNIANGNSQMYDSKVFIKIIEKAGLQVTEVHNDVGNTHTLLVCKKAH